jgi:hypothetical protein
MAELSGVQLDSLQLILRMCEPSVAWVRARPFSSALLCAFIDCV